MLERIWSGWRASYVAGVPLRSDAVREADVVREADIVREADVVQEKSVFRRLLDSGAPDEQTHIVHRGATCFVIVNIFPYTSGHLMVLPYREVADLEDLTDEETAELWATVTTAVRVVRSAYRPDGMNVGLNLGRPAGGSVPTHLHVHVVPRWTGDSNFMSSIANTQTLPESIGATAARLRSAWPR